MAAAWEVECMGMLRAATVFVALAALCGIVPTASAAPVLPTIRDISMGVGEQIPTGFAGVGARGMGMGGAQLAGVQDGTALFWNPAALTNVRRMELLGGLAQLQPSSEAEVGTMMTSRRTASAAFTTLNAAILTMPYPTYRGALTFAVGATRPWDYGYRALREGYATYGSKNYTLSDEVRQEGGLRVYSLGMGLDVSQEVAIGISANWHRGSVDIRRDMQLLETTSYLPDSLVGMYKQSNDISGFGVTVGTTVRLPLGLSLAAVATPPITYEHDGYWGDEYDEAIGTSLTSYYYQENKLKYKLKTPWQLGVGLSWTTYALTLAADVWYADWRQAEYDGAPYDASADVNPDRFFEDRYQSQVRVHLGGEFLVPVVDTYARFGYYHDADPFDGPLMDSGEALRYPTKGHFFTVGLGRLFGQVMAVDVAYVYGGDEYTAGAVKEERNASRVFATLAYRL